MGRRRRPRTSPLQARALGELIRSRRHLRGLTQAQLAEKTEFDETRISKLENGRDLSPTPELLARIAEALEIPLDVMAGASGCRLAAMMPYHSRYRRLAAMTAACLEAVNTEDEELEFFERVLDAAAKDPTTRGLLAETAAMYEHEKFDDRDGSLSVLAPDGEYVVESRFLETLACDLTVAAYRSRRRAITTPISLAVIVGFLTDVEVTAEFYGIPREWKKRINGACGWSENGTKRHIVLRGDLLENICGRRSAGGDPWGNRLAPDRRLRTWLTDLGTIRAAVAHELGHLITESGIGRKDHTLSPKWAENVARRFARALLCPSFILAERMVAGFAGPIVARDTEVTARRVALEVPKRGSRRRSLASQFKVNAGFLATRLQEIGLVRRGSRFAGVFTMNLDNPRAQGPARGVG